MKPINLDNERKQNDPDSYVWGLLYFNPKDKRVLVPKRNNSYGWTVNFARPHSYIVIIGIIGFAIILEKLLSK